MRRTGLMLCIYPIDKFYIGRHKSSKKSHEIPIRHRLNVEIFDLLFILHCQKIETFNTNATALDLIYFCLACNMELIFTNFPLFDARTKAENPL